MKTSELTGAALDWAVAMAENWARADFEVKPYSTNWAQGGPIIERAKIVISPDPQHGWRAMPYMDLTEFYGPTPLAAAMRCFVASVLGEEVGVPEGVL
jgi:hypothetical protein